MGLLTFAREFAVKRRMGREYGAAKTGDTFQEITHIRILFLAGHWEECLSSGGLQKRSVRTCTIKDKTRAKKEPRSILQRNIF
ncbi:hypothetical protein [Rhizobium leguminosarum]|uniref:hypothetical protein n=1 Tax=Rhizobium leguminosarum TaxID=384 RepID=UPI001C948CA5|nr:hypothetical protein [Rhizobium leguminosarum]MBY5349958.1 hypothetical protein [Rhizobium leguminosarum]